ncbi:hypothetical protein TWF281_004216 [Arthrobotrys megalospora]
MVVQINRIINLCKFKSIKFYNQETVTEITLPHSGNNIFEPSPCSPKILQNVPWKSSNNKIIITIIDPDDGEQHSVSIIDDNFSFLLNDKRMGDLRPVEKGPNPNGLLLVVSECPFDPQHKFSVSIRKCEDWVTVDEGNMMDPYSVRRMLHTQHVADLHGW